MPNDGTKVNANAKCSPFFIDIQKLLIKLFMYMYIYLRNIKFKREDLYNNNLYYNIVIQVYGFSVVNGAN